MKTLIELYDERPLENILATEVFRPERTVFLAPREIAGNAPLHEAMQDFLRGRGIAAELTVQAADMNDPQAVLSAMEKVLDRWNDCALDICGGTDAALFAGGLFAARHAVPVFTWSRRKGRFFNIQNAPFADVDTGFIRFGVEDFLRMAGGAMRKGRVDNAVLSRYMWMMEPFFRVFIAGQRTWVRTINYLQTVSQAERGQPASLEVSAPTEVKAARERVRPDNGTLEALQSIGMIQHLRIEPERIRFAFADAQYRAWLRDVGSVLELFVYKACLDSELFDDVRVSVIVDWAGRQEQDGVSNEIDVMASRGLSPFFISCKTGEVKTEALNELAILRDRFGGEMAKAAIVTAETANASVRNRAAELRIGVADADDLANGRLTSLLQEWAGI